MRAHLSYRHKIPLSLSLIVVLTTFVFAIGIAWRTSVNQKQELVYNAERLGKVLANGLVSALRHDAVWRAYQTLRAVASDAGGRDQAPLLIVLNANGEIFVSTQPRQYPMLSTLGKLDRRYEQVEREVQRQDVSRIEVIEQPLRTYVLVPIAADGIRLGTLVMGYSPQGLAELFVATLKSMAWPALVILALLMSFGWLWGRRMASPLVRLADSMSRVGTHPPHQIECAPAAGNDEIGRLGEQFNHMLRELEDKAALEKRMVSADRLAAIGRLTAGIAHEINNPLGGMLNAIDTYKRHGHGDPLLTSRTFSLLERGLRQIKESVSAILVEARIDSHALTPQDIDDIRLLLTPDADGKAARFEWRNEVDRALPLPAAPVRQVMINLLLNAVQAVDPRGTVGCHIAQYNGSLRIAVEDDGRQIDPDQMERLFEPFSHSEADGSGLGLWVTYQIVKQLGGDISLECGDGKKRFNVVLPVRRN